MQSKNKNTPSNLGFPCFLVNFPFTVSADSPNNAWMKDNKDYNYEKAFEQFMELYHYVAGYALIYVLPSEYNFQDLPFVANIGCYLPHLKEDTIIVANFKSPPRKGEDKIADKFFTSMGYKVDRSPFHWEGEADLKYIRDNIYIGGHGIRTDIRSYKWMMSKYDMNIATVKMTDEHLYHFDCVFFPLDEAHALVATKVLAKEDIKSIEKVVDIIEIPEDYIYNGWTNCIRLGNSVLAALNKTDHADKFKKLINNYGYNSVIMDLTEYEKSGADLSCMFLHLNYNNRNIFLGKSDNWWSDRLYKLYKHKIGFDKSLLFKTDIAPEYRSVFSQLPITIEYGVGSRKKLKSGAMSNPYKYPYGFIEKTKTGDGEALDCYVGPNEQASHVYLIKQMKPDSGEFDEIKCVYPNTLIETSLGWMPIKDIVNQKLNIQVRSVDPDTGKACWSNVVGWQKYKTDKWIIIRHNGTRSSYGKRAFTTLRCTPDHMVLTTNGMKAASELTIEDHIFVLGRGFNFLEEQVLMGSLLGDGCIVTNKVGNYCFSEGHSYKQKDYIQWKANVFKANIKPVHSKYKNEFYEFLNFRTERSPIWKLYYDKLYVNGIKEINKYWLDKLGVLGFAVWIMDDGSISNYEYTTCVTISLPVSCSYFGKNNLIDFFKKNYDIISVDGHSTSPNRIQNNLGQWQRGDDLAKVVSWTWIKKLEDGRDYYRLVFNVNASSYILDLIKPYLISDSNLIGTKKLWIASNIESEDNFIAIPTKIRDISTSDVNRIYKSTCYDLTVDQTHLFVPNGVVTSNCMLGFDSMTDASKAYIDHYKDIRFFGGVIPLEMKEFKRILGEKQNLQIIKSMVCGYK